MMAENTVQQLVAQATNITALVGTLLQAPLSTSAEFKEEVSRRVKYLSALKPDEWTAFLGGGEDNMGVSVNGATNEIIRNGITSRLDSMGPVSESNGDLGTVREYAQTAEFLHGACTALLADLTRRNIRATVAVPALVREDAITSPAHGDRLCRDLQDIYGKLQDA